MKILLTGYRGYIGRHLIPKLTGHEVIMVDLLDGVDLTKEVVKAGPFDLIYHLASYISVQESFEKPEKYVLDNVLMTLRMLEHKTKIIFASTAGVYGDNIVPSTEFNTPYPDNPYTIGKFTSEMLIRNSGVSHAILRFSNVFGGVGEKGVRKMLRDGNPINGDGEQVRDFVHVEDVTNALVMAQNWNGTFNIGSGQGTTINELADALGTPKVYGPPVKETRRSILDIRMAIAMGWKPTISIKDKEYATQ